MRPVLFSIPHITPLACLAVFAVVVLAVGIWLGVLKSRNTLTRDHLVTGITIAGLAGIFLLIVNWIGQFKVNAYGAMLMIGFLVGMFTAVRLGKRRGVPMERLLDLGLLVLLSAVVGARVMYLVITPNAGPFIDPKTILSDGLGGLSFYGGLLGGLVATILYVRATKLHFWRVIDCLAPGVAVGYAITRIGCFLNGCCYGTACKLPWAVTFPELHDANGALIRHAIENVHPSQLYASLMGFTMFGILLWLSRGQSLGRAGRLAMVFFALEGVERFVMEFFRQPDPNFHGLLTPAQIFCLLLIAAAVVGWFMLPASPAIPEPVPTPAPAPMKGTKGKKARAAAGK